MVQVSEFIQLAKICSEDPNYLVGNNLTNEGLKAFSDFSFLMKNSSD